MREKIRRLAKEEFQYELPPIILSKDFIELSIENGRNYKESLFIKTSEKIKMKGLIYCTCPYVKTDMEAFLGMEANINLDICVCEKKAGEKITGELILVTDCGEKRIPIILNVVKHYVTTSLGQIRDLFQFANLAKTSPIEALQLFTSKEFKDIFLKKDGPETVLYDSLIKSDSKSHAMEEFLIAIHKKKKITIEAEKKTIFYENAEESFSDKIVLQKDTWGYEEVQIKSNVDFFIPTVKKIWTNQFVGNQYELEYIVEPKHMRYGKNYGMLEIITANGVQSIEIVVKRHTGKREERTIQKQGMVELVQNYLNFRLRQIDSDTYGEEGEAILEKIGDGMEPFLKELIKIQLSFASGKKELSKSLFEHLKEKEEQIKNSSGVIYCSYQYLKALQEGTNEAIENAVIFAEVCYNQTKKWKYLWFLLYLDKKYEVGQLRLKVILEQLEAGCTSPVLYYELCTLYNQNPKRLKELTKGTVRAIHWGRKVNYLSGDLVLQYVLLAGKMSRFHPVIYSDLKALYEIYQTEEILKGICKMLIRNEKADKKYFFWYQLGVEKQLRITNLYEYYMYSLEEEKVTELPQGILIYFLYDSCLTDKKKAFLYAYIVKNKEKNPSDFESYEKQIQKFAIEQLEKGHNDANLSVLYEELFRDGFSEENLLEKIVKVMFQYEIFCQDFRMKGVYVLHKELEKEEYAPLEKGKAIVSLYTEGAKFVFADIKGNRYTNIENYSVKKLNHLERYMEQCYQMGSKNPMLLLSLCEKIGRYHKKKDNSEQIRKQTLLLNEIKPGYRRTLYKQLLEYYYDNMNSEELEALLLDENFMLSKEEQSRRIELCMICGLEKQALSGLTLNPWDDIPVNRIQRFVTRILSRNGMEEKDDLLVKLAYHVFEKGKCSKLLLNYLCRYYQGHVSSMFELWKRCQDCECDPDKMERLEEELLCQALFAETVLAEYFVVFESYYKRGIRDGESEKPTIIQAFLVYEAYRYVVHEDDVDERIFDILKTEIVNEECEIGRIALLKYYSGKKTLTEEEKEFSDFQIHQFTQKNIVFPFFVDFKNKLMLPHKVSSKFYVEYKANPEKKVYINYAFAGKEKLKFVTEPMKQIYPGIFTKDFVLFYNEELEYYIYEEQQELRTITESASVTMELSEDTGENRQDMLNLMLLAMELQDEKTLITSMEEYIRRKYAGDKLFKTVP